MKVNFQQYQHSYSLQHLKELPLKWRNALLNAQYRLSEGYQTAESLHFEAPDDLNNLLNTDFAHFFKEIYFPFTGFTGSVNSYHGYVSNADLIFEPLLLLNKSKWQVYNQNLGFDFLVPCIRIIPFLRTLSEKLNLQLLINEETTNFLANKRMFFPQTMENYWNWGKLLGFQFNFQTPSSIIQNLYRAQTWQHGYSLNSESLKVKAFFPFSINTRLSFNGTINYQGNASGVIRIHRKILMKNGNFLNEEHYRIAESITQSFIAAGSKPFNYSFDIEILAGEQLILYYELLSGSPTDFLVNVNTQLSISSVDNQSEEWSIGKALEGYKVSVSLSQMEQALGCTFFINPVERSFEVFTNQSLKTQYKPLKLLFPNIQAHQIKSEEESKPLSSENEPIDAQKALVLKNEILRLHPNGFEQLALYFQEDTLRIKIYFFESEGFYTQALNQSEAQTFRVENNPAFLSRQKLWALPAAAPSQSSTTLLKLQIQGFTNIESLAFLQIGSVYEWQRVTYALKKLNYDSELKELHIALESC